MPTPWGPLVRVCGAPGTGKTTLLPALVDAADGEVIIDIDEILVGGALLGVPIAVPEAAPLWPAYDQMWDMITDMVRRAGHPVIRLEQVPDPGQPARAADRVHWMALDCPDGLRARRLRERGWSRELIDGALADAALCRRMIPTAVEAREGESTDEIAGRVLGVARSMISSAPEGMGRAAPRR